MERAETLPPRDTTSDPKVFLEGFYNSNQFNNGRHNDVNGSDLRGLSDFIAQVKVRADKADPPTDDEIRSAYLSVMDSRLLMADFAKHDLMLTYSAENYPPSVNSLYDEYKDIVLAMQKFQNPDEIMRYDQARTNKHYELARALVHDNISPSVEIGRTIARIWLISEGMDSFNAYENDEIERVKRVI